jgi:hypothetical protein
MRTFVKIVLLAELFAVATYALGWWTVPIIAADWGIATRDFKPARIAALCAAAGWATLLILDVVKGPVDTMASKLGGVMGVPAFVLLLLTLIFPALLAWSAAALASSVRRRAVTSEGTA